jgi:hypothetical protein
VDWIYLDEDKDQWRFNWYSGVTLF